jgi:hypothetical protein
MILRILVLGILSSIHALPCLAWGRVGHEVLASVAADIAGSGNAFWSRNGTRLGQLAVVPDSLWKSGSSANREGPTHWFHMDAYCDDPWQLPMSFDSFQTTVDAYGSAVVTENGSAFWRARQLFRISLDAFQKGRAAEGLQMAGVLAHYVGDLSQPLHVSEDYDGRYGLQTGIHSFFETTVLSRQSRTEVQQQVRSRALALRAAWSRTLPAGDKDIALIIRDEMARSAAWIDKVLTVDEELGRGSEGSAAQYQMALDRLADGAATMSILLEKIWNDAGQPDLSDSIRVSDPQWIAPNYNF